MDNNQLIEKYQGGDESAFNKIYHRFKDRIFWFIYGYVKNQQDAEDLTQDTFLDLVRFHNQYSPGRAKFSTWLYHMAKMNCYTYYKHNNNTKNGGVEISIDKEPETGKKLEIKSSSPLPDRIAGDKILMEKVKSKMKKINTDYAVVVNLYDLREFTYKEICNILGVNMGTVKSRLHRGRSYL